MNSRIISFDSIIPVIIESLDKNNSIKIKITGNSMWPMLRHNKDCVYLTKAKKINRYDVVLFKKGDGHYVLHRVLTNKNDLYDICGDNTFYIDRNIKREDIIAVVSSFERKGKFSNINNFTYRFYINFWFLKPIFTLRKYCKILKNKKVAKH